LTRTIARAGEAAAGNERSTARADHNFKWACRSSRGVAAAFPPSPNFPAGILIQGGLPVMHQNDRVGAIGGSGVASHEDALVAQTGSHGVGGLMEWMRRPDVAATLMVALFAADWATTRVAATRSDVCIRPDRIPRFP
jgi:hypothetical protein